MLRIVLRGVICAYLKIFAISAGRPHLYENRRYPHPSQAACFSFDSDIHMEDGAADDRLPPEEQVKSGAASFSPCINDLHDETALDGSIWRCWSLHNDNAQPRISFQCTLASPQTV